MAYRLRRLVPVHWLPAIADDRRAGDEPDLGVGDRQCAAPAGRGKSAKLMAQECYFNICPPNRQVLVDSQQTALLYSVAMSSWLRITLTWLLALALPLQGYAAQSMFPCGSGHSVPAVRVASEHHGDIAHVSTATADERAQPTATSPARDAGGDTTAKAAKGKCSVCSTCCSVCGMTSDTRVFEASPTPTLYTTERELLRPGNVQSGLERPPRNVFA